ncbi:MAG TPA: hypothetical protein VHI96_08770 [Solirubrobacterales bacterium]|jgi:hypothetical protein|nr:hypothetical protein [Solirubrobacterales bacterium]
MSAPVRIAAFAVGLALLFTAATVAGGAVDPDVDDGSGEHGMESEESAMNGHETMSADTEALPGLATSQAGYRIAPAATTAPAGPRTPYEFTIVGPDGEPLTEYAVEHERRMHLIVVRRDFAGFQHVHPELAADGTWSVAIDTRLPGTYRVLADFTTADEESLTLGTDLSVPGRVDPKPLPMPEPAADADAGYEVTLASAEPEAGTATRLKFTVSRDGRPIEQVQPYLGADGHLVVLREGDLAFLHAHPQGEPGGAGPVAFDVDYPSAGAYRLFLQFRHDGAVHTAAFTVIVGGEGATSVAGQNGTEANHGH